jgi:L-lactate dehydrogenase complex protein LldF
MLTGLSDAKDLPFASTLCGACREACPVKINLPRMLLRLRREVTEGTTFPDERRVSLFEKIAMKGWRLSVANGFALGLTNRLARLAQWPLVRGGRLTRLPPPLSGWTRSRNFPAVAVPFRDRWRRYLRDQGRGDE